MKIINGGDVLRLLKDTKIPKMFWVKQTLNKEMTEMDKIKEVIFNELSKSEFSSLIKAYMNIAITAGSSGIKNTDIITKHIVDFVKFKKSIPFIIPAMGSHGGDLIN